MIVTNLRQVVAGMDKVIAGVDAGTKRAVVEMAATAERFAKQEASTGTHKRGEPHIPGTGPGPNVVTGSLRRSIRFVVHRSGFAAYSATVGPTVNYGRAVELGGDYGPPSWRGTSAEKGFPFMRGALQKLRPLMHGILAKHIGGMR